MVLQQKLEKLEQQLIITKKKLQRSAEQNKSLASILQDNNQAKKSTTITIKSATKIEFVQVDDIVCCNADEGYTNVQLMDGRTITASKILSSFEKILTKHSFFRISKSHLINTNHIVTFHKDRNQILLQGKILLDIARRRRVEFLKTLN